MAVTVATPVVRIQSGSLSGEGDGAVHAYKGVPYAAPPVGALRWRSPQPAPSWGGVRDATRFAPDCMQVYSAVPSLDSGRSRAPGMSEDCLYLNVWTPSDQPDAGLPVLVWFHGGGFARGSGAEPVYDGRALARRGIVVVSVNYRLGAFGFMAHPALSRESGHGASGNYGIHDAVAALRWTRENIARFGGDPQCVTICGQSAGGAIVANLMVSPLAGGLFQRVIAMSPGSFRPLAPLHDAEQYGLLAGADIDALRELPAYQVLALNKNYVPKARGLTTPRMLRTIVDGLVMPEQEMSLFVSGRFCATPLLVGGCEDEGAPLAAGSPMSNLPDFQAFMAANFGAHRREALALYPATSDAQAPSAYQAALGDSQFHYAPRSMARISARVQPDTYRYYFTRKTGGMTRRAQHCDELSYVFGALDEGANILGLNPPNDGERALADTMQDAWVRFMTTGDPNGGAITDWPRYDGDADQSVEFGDAIRVTRNVRRAQMDLLDRTYGLFQ